jgi:hypothetical protein
MTVLGNITSAVRVPRAEPPVDAVKADHRHAERNYFGTRVRDWSLYSGIGGALFGVTMGGIGASMALGALTEGLPAGVTRASRIPLALKHLGGWTLGGIVAGAAAGAAIAGAYGLLMSGNERFHL